jgi:hypothetical protein
MHSVSYRSTISTTSWEAKREITPRGIKITLTIKNVEMTQPGVRIGLQAGSSCCVNFEYLGRFEFFLAAEESPDPAAPALDDAVLELMAEKTTITKPSLEGIIPESKETEIGGKGESDREKSGRESKMKRKKKNKGNKDNTDYQKCRNDPTRG